MGTIRSGVSLFTIARVIERKIRATKEGQNLYNSTGHDFVMDGDNVLIIYDKSQSSVSR